MQANYLKMRLVDIAQINPPKSTVVGSNSIVAFIPFCAVNDSDRIIPERKRLYQLNRHCREFQRGDILLPKIASGLHGRKIAVVEIDQEFGFCSQEFFVIRPDTDIVHTRYLYHWLRQHSLTELILNLQGTAQKRVPSDVIIQLLVNVPQLAEQERFALIMDAAAREREIYLQQFQNAEKTIVALFRRWLQKLGRQSP